MSAIRLVATVAFVFAGLASGVQSNCLSPSSCLNATAFAQLSTSNPTYYCEQGAILYYKALSCFKACGTTDTTGQLSVTKTAIDAFCAKSSPNCTSVTDTYVNQTQCFVPYGGLNAVTQAVFSNFTAGQSLGYSCTRMFWGRNCQTYNIYCRYNLDLDLQLIKANPQIILGLAVCGSENLESLAESIVDNSACSSAMNAAIEAQCGIACELAAAVNDATVCSLMQQQANCISGLSAGCTNAQMQYLLPRFDSYAIANAYLKCSIQVDGLIVQPPASTQCTYVDQLNTCLYASVIADAIDWTRLQALYDMNLPVGGFCRNLANVSQAVASCSASYLACPIPHSFIYPSVTTYDDSYTASLGVFPLNEWGMSSIFSWMNGVCPNPQWTDQICQPATTTTTTTKAATMKAAATTTKAAALKTGGTPPASTTPSPSTSTTTGAAHQSTPAVPGPNAVAPLKGAAGDERMISFVLLVGSGLLAKLVPRTAFSV